MNNLYKDKVIVAMSGGVDSTTVAALLHKKRYQVIGVTLQLYKSQSHFVTAKSCCAGQDIYDAKNAANQIGIPHYIVNYEKIFNKHVIENFTQGYSQGETPIPCIRCNQKVKFADLYLMAKKLGAKFLATGHYVRKIKKDGEDALFKGVDPLKDQSYFMFATTKKQLSFLEFPLGHMTKDQTRELAQDLKLDVYNKPESQDLCFVSDGHYAEVIKKLQPALHKIGDIVLTNGRIIGTHNGIINYTIGQRRGLKISFSSPLYVIEIIPETNTIVVGSQSLLLIKKFNVKDINWLLDESLLKQEISCQVKLRSQQKPISAKIKFSNKTATVMLSEYIQKTAPGQACVMYDNNRVLGGGWVM